MNVLITGMSAVGKSTVLAALAARGHRTVDTDHGDWIAPDDTGEPLWHPGRMTALLDEPRDRTLYVAGTVANQGAFYPRFGTVVLLTAPPDVLLHRIDTRTTNDFGKLPGQRAAIVRDIAEVEPLLRRGAHLEVDTRLPLGAVVRTLELAARTGGTR